MKKKENIENFEKIVVLDNQVQACLIQPLLDEQKIPYFVRSYYDAAYDGLFQSTMGWGHIEAPPEFKDEIISIFNNLKTE